MSHDCISNIADDQKRSLVELRIATAIFESLEGVMITDSRGVIVRVNLAFTKITGFTEEEAIGRSPRMLRSGRQSVDFYEAMWSQIRRTGEWQGEIWNRRKNGEMFRTWLNVSAVLDDDGVATNYIGRLYVVVPNKNDENVAQKLNREIVDSHQRLRDMVAQTEAAREEERRHIAREVHDELGQLLTALCMNMSLLELRLAPLLPTFRDEIQGMKDLANRAIQGVRNVAGSLRPAVLDMGLVPALEWLSIEFTKHASIACTVDAREPGVDLDEARSVAVFRIVQESLTNVSRYANASQVWITLFPSGHELYIEVRDNGIGFDQVESAKRRTFGLLGMRERAIALGGRVDITSSLGRGTKISLSIPVSALPVGEKA